MRAAILSWFFVTACADILDLRAGRAEPDTCASTQDCAPDSVCRDGRCAQKCGSSASCPRNDSCSDGVCIPRTPCVSGEGRCSGLMPQVCQKGDWVAPGDRCDTGCKAGACVDAPSCDWNPLCGGPDAASGSSCCEAFDVPGGTVTVPYDGPNTDGQGVRRSVSPFVLERFEVTVSRFRQFVAAYDQLNLADGDGAHPDVPGSGWNESWKQDPVAVAPNAVSLRNYLAGCGVSLDVEGETLPIRCVNWYEAFAFCVWDGGRLPTETEWAFAAMGGDEARPYPWSTSVADDSINSARAVYTAPPELLTSPEPVGLRPRGAGIFGQEDLAGNVAEWVADMFFYDLQNDTCASAGMAAPRDCIELRPSVSRVQRGGSYKNVSDDLKNSRRLDSPPRTRYSDYGFRCARDPQ